MKKVLYFISIFFFIFMSCQKNEHKEKRLRICFNMDPKTLDSRKSGDLATSATLFLLNSGLTEAQKDGSITPALCYSYDISLDKKTYVFHLKDATWSDGHPITAKDFEKSWKKIIDPTFPSLCPQLFYPIKNAEKAAKGEVSLDEVGINALDDKTLIVHLNNPTPYFLSLTSFCIYFPIPTHLEENSSTWDSFSDNNLVSSGPFLLKKWKKGSEMVLQKNPKFWNKDEIFLDEIHISIVDNETTALQMYENDELDWVGALLSPLPLDSIPTIIKSKECFKTPIGGASFCVFNTDIFPFNNKNIRKAFGLAINREEIVNNITQGGENIASRLIPPKMAKNRRDFFNDKDNEQAKELFEKALLELNIKKEDLNITFSYGSNLLHKKQAEALQQYWQNTFNIPIKLEMVEEKTFMDKIHKHKFQAALSYLIVQYNDPMNIFDRFKNKSHSKNYPLYESETYQDLLNYSSSEIDENKRELILEKAEEIILDDMPISPIYHHNYILLTKPYVKNLFVGPVGEVRFDKVYFKK